MSIKAIAIIAIIGAGAGISGVKYLFGGNEIDARLAAGVSAVPEVTNKSGKAAASTETATPAPSKSTTIEDTKIINNVSIDKINLSEAQVVRLYGEVDYTEPLVQKLQELGRGKKPIYLLINSPGGSVIDGAAVLSAMEASSVPVHTVCVSVCASMAAIIHQYGTTRLAVDRSILMFHPASGGFRGEFPSMQSRMNFIGKYVHDLSAYVARRNNLTPEDFEAKADAELWMDARTALQKGFVDALVSPNIDTSIMGKVGALSESNSRRNNLTEMIKWISAQ